MKKPHVKVRGEKYFEAENSPEKMTCFGQTFL